MWLSEIRVSLRKTEDNRFPQNQNNMEDDPLESFAARQEEPGVFLLNEYDYSGNQTDGIRHNCIDGIDGQDNAALVITPTRSNSNNCPEIDVTGRNSDAENPPLSPTSTSTTLPFQSTSKIELDSISFADDFTTHPFSVHSLLTNVRSAPPDFLTVVTSSGSPLKKVQFQVGDGGDGDDDDSINLNSAMSQPNMEAPTPGAPMDSSRNRAEIRDHVATPSASIALLPAIAEERSGRPPSAKRSISVDPSNSASRNSTALNLHDMAENKSDQVYGFVQLDVLTGEGEINQREWKEKARWIKYEEDVEEGSDRWGKPHVATLSFHSLIKLKQLFEREAVIMIDVEEVDMPGVAYRIVEELVKKTLINEEDSALLMRVLLLKHKHVQEPDGWLGRLKRSGTAASALSLHSLLDDKGRSKSILDPTHVLVQRNNSIQKAINEMGGIKALQRTGSGHYLKRAESGFTSGDSTANVTDSKPLGMSDAYQPSVDDLKWIQKRRILPLGAESTMIMVGEFDSIRKPFFVVARLAEAAFMFNITEVPVPTRFFSILIAPSRMEMDLVEIGRSFGTLMSNKDFYEIALTASGRKNFMSGINDFLDDSIVLPPGDWDNSDLLPLHILQSNSKAIKLRRLKKQMSFIKSSESFCDGVNGKVYPMIAESNEKKEPPPYDPYERTGRPFGGLFNDVRRRVPWYISDFVDGFNLQCLGTIIFMYCASIAQVITFAGLMGDKTRFLIGASETLLSTCIAGVIFALFSCQPLIPIGPTGPLLVFDEILFKYCLAHDLDFLQLRVWISIWVLAITLVVTCFELNVLVKWFTRFTQDIFAVLTSVLLIFESVDNLIEIYIDHPLTNHRPHTKQNITLTIVEGDYNMTFSTLTTPAPIIDETIELSDQPNTALLCTILMLGTFFIAYFLREFRNSVFLGERARRILGDFGVPIAITTMVLLDYFATDTYTQKITVPGGLQPTSPDERGWFISATEDLEWIIVFGSMIPALLIFILIFMTTQICELITNKKERRLVKGGGLHFDIVLIALINVACGFMGAPWLCTATLRGLAHVTALTVYSTNNPPGEKPTIVQVREQRVTCLTVAILIGVSVLLSDVLELIPLAVLFGVFLYLGISSLSSTQLFERFRLMFIPSEHHPQVPYVRHVRTLKMHIYTLIQLGCLGMLYGVKSVREAALAFPFVLMFLVPIRMQLKHFFNDNELDALDGDSSLAKKNQ